MFQRTFKLLIVSSCLIASSNAMDNFNNIAINNNMQLNSLEQNNNIQTDNLNLSNNLSNTIPLKLSGTNSLKLSGALGNINSVFNTTNPLKLSGILSNNENPLKLSGALNGPNSLKLSGVFDDYNNIKYKNNNVKNIKTITNNKSSNISNLDAEATVNESKINNNNNVINISNNLSISNNDPAINNAYNINTQTNTNTSQNASINLLNKQVQNTDININKTEEQINNSNKEDAANAKKNKKKKNKSSEQEQKEAVAELQARITKHLKSGKFILFGKLHQQIMNSIKDNKEDKIYSTLNVDPYILDKYKEYYSIVEQCIKELLPSKIGKSLVELQFFKVMNKSNKVLIDIYNFLENNYEYTADDDNDVNETIRYVVDDEAGEIDIQNIVGNDILRTIGNLAAAISDLCLYTQPALLQLVFSGLTDNNNFKLACNQFYYIGKVFGIKELLINH